MRRVAAVMSLLVLASCGGGGGSPGADAGTPEPTAPTIENLQGLAFEAATPAAGSNVACSGATDGAAAIGTVHFAQTHLLEPAHPFFHLSANRSATVRASITGVGAAPQVSVTARRGGAELGTVCLAGPATLPASVDNAAPSAANSFIGHLPADWVQAGLELTLRAGSASRTFSAAELKIGPAPELTLVTVDWLLFGDTEVTPVPEGMRGELAARLPLSKVIYADFPIDVPMPTLPIPPRGDATNAAGVAGAQPAVLANSLPHCSAADKAASTCTPWSGFGVISAVRSLTATLQQANGMDWLSHWYGALSKNRHAGGGLGGGVTGAGDDYQLVFNHELGHAFDMPHWGDALYSKVDPAAATRHPYTGVLVDPSGAPRGGGYGNTWAWDPLTASMVDPVCADGRERQEPMQRGVDCSPPNHVFDFFSDYSALYVHRYFNGAATGLSGTVASPRDRLGNLMAPFAFPTKGGRPNLVAGAAGAAPRIVRWNEASQSYQDEDSTSKVYGEKYPLQWNVPVVTLWGSFSNATEAATTIQTPLRYKGNVKRVWDPTSQADFDAMKAFISGDAFWWGADLVVKAEFSDGRVQHALIKGSVRSTDALSGDSFKYWAVNLAMPEGVKVTRVSLYHRPMTVRYAGSGTSSYNFVENLNADLNKGLTAAQYLDSARLVATRSF